MSISVSVPKDLDGIKTKVVFNLTKRQLVCFSLAAMAGVPLYFGTKDYLGTSAATYLMVGMMLPFFFLAMYEKDGFPAEKILYFMIRQKFLIPGRRPYKRENLHEKLKEVEKEIQELESKAGSKIRHAKGKGIPKEAGLNTLEKKRLKKLKRILTKINKEKKTMDTAQKSIPFQKIYQDGICRVTRHVYSKMVEFYDINYMLLEEEQKGDILEDYSRILNYFDPEVKFQLFLFNRKVSEERLARQFEVNGYGDTCEEIAKEYEEILKKQSRKGTNGILKSKFLIFTVECENYGEARNRLNTIEKDIIEQLHNLGARAYGVDGKERLRILYEYFNQGTTQPFRFSFEDITKNGKTVKDYIAPAEFDFRYPDGFKSGGMYGRSCYLNIVAPKLTDELLHEILEIDDNLSVSMHMQNVGTIEAIKMVKANLSNVQKSKIDEQKKAVHSGYDMDILPPDIVTYEREFLELLEDLNTSNQKMIKMSFFITCFGKTKQQMEHLIQKVSGIIQRANCELNYLGYLQEQGFMASTPIGYNGIERERKLSTKCIAILVPFCTRELFMEPPAIYYGLNALSNNMIMADRKKLRTPNGVILGTPGSGKSFASKREMLPVVLSTTDDILICDPEGEYYPVVESMGGQVIKLATNSKDYLNPMDIQLSHKNDREALKLKSDFLITLCDQIAGGKYGLANDEKGIIDECIRHIYDGYFKNPVPENMPILEDLYNALVCYEPRNVAKELSMDAKAKAVRIANSLVLYVHGSQNYFNHRTTVDSRNRIICFDIKDLGNQLKEIGMLIVQDAVWNRVSRNRERRIATRYYCDEFHLLLKEKQTASYCVEIWKRFRKWGGIPTAMTQNVGDFLKSEEIEGILGNSDFIYLLNQNAKDQKILADKLDLSKKQLSYVTNSEQGCGLIIYDDVVIPFVDKYPKNTLTYKIMNTKPEESKEEGI